MSTRSLVIPSYQGDSIIFHNFRISYNLREFYVHTLQMLIKRESSHRNIHYYPLNLPSLFFVGIFSLFLHFNLVHASACTHCSPLGKPSGLQACTPTVEGAKKEKISTNKERGEILGKGGLCKKYKILLSLHSRQRVA